MLGKLLKYEIPALGRKLIPLYIAWVATALVVGVMLLGKHDVPEFLTVISGLIYVAVTTAVVVMTIILIIQRYARDLLGDGGYFSHTLPVGAGTHIAGKTIGATLWVLISILIAVLTCLITVAITAGWNNISYSLSSFFGDFDARVLLLIIEFVILATASLAKSILAVYAAITIGYQARRHKVLYSIIAYIGVLIFESVLAKALTSLVNIDQINITSLDQIGSIQFFFCFGFAVSIAIGAVYFLISRYLMTRRLNLD